MYFVSGAMLTDDPAELARISLEKNRLDIEHKEKSCNSHSAQTEVDSVAERQGSPMEKLKIQR